MTKCTVDSLQNLKGCLYSITITLGVHSILFVEIFISSRCGSLAYQFAFAGLGLLMCGIIGPLLHDNHSTWNCITTMLYLAAAAVYADISCIQNMNNLYGIRTDTTILLDMIIADAIMAAIFAAIYFIVVRKVTAKLFPYEDPDDEPVPKATADPQ